MLTLRLLRQAVDRSQRNTGVQLHVNFVRREDPDIDPPLAQILRGGRGGEIRLKVYLCICLLATKQPYDIRAPIAARTWAEMLALEEPETNGARRVADALAWLNDFKLIKLDRRIGKPPQIRLLSPSRNEKEWTRPRNPYVQVPLDLWRQQWIVALSGPALGLLLALIDLQGGIKSASNAPSLPGEQRRRYGFSDDTWSRASKQLVQRELLTIKRIKQGRDLDWRRVKNTYWVHLDRLRDRPSDDTTVNP